MSAHISQQKAARIAGFMFLITMATSILTAFVLRGGIISPGNMAETVNNIIANEQQFRLSIAIDLITYSAIFLLPLSLYVVLRPVNKTLASFGFLLRFGEALFLFMVAVCPLLVLRLSTGGEYQTLLDPSHLQGLIKMLFNAMGSAFEIAMILLCMGSLAFNYLFLKSGYIPKLLALWGLIACSFTLVCLFLVILLPDQASAIRRFMYLPMFIDEVALGLWLLIKGVNVPNREDAASIST